MIDLVRIDYTLDNGKTRSDYYLFKDDDYRSIAFSSMAKLKDPEIWNLYIDDTYTLKRISKGNNATITYLTKLQDPYEQAFNAVPEEFI